MTHGQTYRSQPAAGWKLTPPHVLSHFLWWLNPSARWVIKCCHHEAIQHQRDPSDLCEISLIIFTVFSFKHKSAPQHDIKHPGYRSDVAQMSIMTKEVLLLKHLSRARLIFQLSFGGNGINNKNEHFNANKHLFHHYWCWSSIYLGFSEQLACFPLYFLSYFYIMLGWTICFGYVSPSSVWTSHSWEAWTVLSDGQV